MLEYSQAERLLMDGIVIFMIFLWVLALAVTLSCFLVVAVKVYKEYRKLNKEVSKKVSDKFKIGPWHIERSYKGSTQPDTWEFWHEDYDGAPVHSFGPPADNRCGFDRTLEDVLESIEAVEEREKEGTTS